MKLFLNPFFNSDNQIKEILIEYTFLFCSKNSLFIAFHIQILTQTSRILIIY